MKAKFIYESINFERSKNPLKTLGIGKEILIKNWLDEHNLDDYGINDDWTIDLYSASGIDFKHIPNYIQFNIVNGKLFAYNLDSLKGFPKQVNGSLTFRGNIKIQDISKICDVKGIITKM